MSVDPYMRGRMNDTASYIPPFQLGAALEGGAVGEVVSLRAATHQVGDHVLHMQGWSRSPRCSRGRPCSSPVPRVISKRLRIEGFLASDQALHQAEFLAEVGPALANGSLRARETVVDGLENAPSAFVGLLSGAKTGKMLVRT